VVALKARAQARGKENAQRRSRRRRLRTASRSSNADAKRTTRCGARHEDAELRAQEQRAQSATALEAQRLAEAAAAGPRPPARSDNPEAASNSLPPSYRLRVGAPDRGRGPRAHRRD
jgi:hypothetical protein